VESLRPAEKKHVICQEKWGGFPTYCVDGDDLGRSVVCSVGVYVVGGDRGYVKQEQSSNATEALTGKVKRHESRGRSILWTEREGGKGSRYVRGRTARGSKRRVLSRGKPNYGLKK